MNNNLEFTPTATWIREHKYRPKSCGETDCYCILDHFNDTGYGFCVGIQLNNENDLDIISFCPITYSDDENAQEEYRFLWHPNEASLIAIYLHFAAMSAWALMPNYRKQLGQMSGQRTRQIKKRVKKTIK